MTSAPCSARCFPTRGPAANTANSTARIPSKAAFKSPLSSRACKAFNPAPHLSLGAFDIFRTEPFRQLDSLDRIHRPLEVLFIPIRKRRVDAHAAFEPSIRGRPFFIARREPLLRLEGLSDAAGKGIQNIGVRIHPR